jgi:type I restriction enzyme S subunit
MSEPNKNRSGYKETKVGWIPDTWEAAQYQDVTVFSGGYGFPEDLQNEASEGVPFIKVSDMNRAGNERLILTASNYVSPETVEENRWKPFPPNATVFAKVGAALLLNRRRMLRCPTLIDNNMMAAVPMKGVNALFLFYSLQSLDLKRLVAVGALPSVNQRDLNTARLPLPPINECGRIAEILSTCDEVIEKTSALIDAKKRQKKALMQQLLTGKKRLPGFDGEWKEVRIGEIFKEVSRPVKWNDEELYNLISVRRRSGGLFFRDALHGKDILTKVMNTTRTGDFLISKMQVVHGAMAMTPPEFDGGHVSGSYITLVTTGDAAIYMPFFDQLSRTKWLYHLSFISSYGVVIEKMTFNLDDFLKKTILIPPTIIEQERISDVLKTCEDEEAALGRKLTALKQQKKALMQKLLTGQVRVKV